MRLGTRALAELPFDPTPVIDLALLLVLLFVGVLELSRREITPPERDLAPVQLLEVRADGSVLAGERLLDDPARADGQAGLRTFLDELARAAPPAAVAVHAERSTPFELVDRVMRLCEERHVAVAELLITTGGGR